MNVYFKLEELFVEFKLKLTDKTHPERLGLFLVVVVIALAIISIRAPFLVLWVLIFVGAIYAIKVVVKIIRLISYAVQVRKTNKYNEKTWKCDSRISEPPYSR